MDVGRWFIGTDAFGEGGSNTGTNLNIVNYSDTGTSIGTVNPLTIYRSNGAVAIANLTSISTLTSSGPAVFSGTITLPCNGGSAYIKAGTGDGASFTTYNLKINSHWGIGFGDYQDLSTVKAYLNTREGSLGLSGSLGVGTASSGTDGEIRAANNITAYYSSDIRLKTNIKPIENSLFKLQQINGMTFDWTDEEIERRGGEDGYFVRKHDVGVIAQEVEIVLPEIVAERLDGYKAVKYEMIVPLLIEAIKEMSTKIDMLQNRIEELEN